jgi:orotidine-5'-phosphate decarboxylase
MNFRDKLQAAADRNDSLLCVGLDPRAEQVPTGDVLTFCREIIAATHDLACAYKPQSAFFEALGVDGWRILRDVIAAVPDGIPVLLDVKRGDVASTAEAYATACYDVLGADAVTVNPYLGGDSVAPFLARPDKTAFIVCRTSNPGAGDVQDLAVPGDAVTGNGNPAEGGAQPLFLRVADLAREWGAPHGNSGLVVGATYPGELRLVRDRCPDLPILLPGIGAQGGDLEASVQAGVDQEGGGLLVSASRSVMYASAGPDWAEAARQAAARLRDQINAVRRGQAALPER